MSTPDQQALSDNTMTSPANARGEVLALNSALDLKPRDDLEGEFDDALAKAQANFGAIERNRTVHVKSKSTGIEYDFKYAELSVILAACRPALNAEGISFRQYVRVKSPTDHMVVTQLRRRGFKIEDEFPINLPQSNHPQDYGAAVSYAKRLGGRPPSGWWVRMTMTATARRRCVGRPSSTRREVSSKVGSSRWRMPRLRQRSRKRPRPPLLLPPSESIPSGRSPTWRGASWMCCKS